MTMSWLTIIQFTAFKRRHTQRRLVTGCLLAMMLGSLPALAQNSDATAPPAADTAATAPAEAASVSAVSELDAQTTQALDESRSTAAPRDDITQLKERVKKSSADLAQQVKELRELLKNRPRVEQIQSLRQQWVFQRDELTANQNTVKTRVDELEAAVARLQELEGRWDAIKTQINDGKLPAETRKPVTRAVNAIGTVKRQLNTTLREAANLAFAWQELANTADDVLNDIKKNEVTQRSALLTNLQPPLWTLTRADLHFEELSSDWASKQVRLLLAYIQKKRAAFMTLIVISFSVLWIMLRMRKRPETYMQLREGQHLRFALTERPYSTTAAFAAALAILMLTNQPRLLRVFFALLMFMPVVRLGIPLMRPQQRPLVWHISVLYLINNLATLTASVSGIERVTFVGLAIAALVATIFAIRNLPVKPTEHAGAWRTLRATLWLSGPIAAAAFIAGVVGAVALSELLISSLVSSAYLGLSLLVIVGIISDFLTTMLHLPAVQSRINMTRNHAALIAERLRRLVTIIGILSWVSVVANQFLIGDLIWHNLTRIFNTQAGIGNISVSLGDVLAMGITIWLSLQLSRFVRFVFEEDVVPRTRMQRGMPTTISTLLHYFIVLIGFLMAISAAGIDLSKIAILAGALGVGIGIGLQDVVSNFTAGLILMFENQVKPGDIVQCDAASGRVINVGLRCSIVRTGDGSEVIVPNSKLTSTPVINWTRSDQSRRLAITIGARYGTDPSLVVATLTAIAKADPDVMNYPEAGASFQRFGVNALEFEVRAWVASGESLGDVNSRICTQIALQFAELGIEMPFAQQELNIRGIDPQLAALLRSPAQAAEAKSDAAAPAQPATEAQPPAAVEPPPPPLPPPDETRGA
jgi:potassium-dependent mechanosensitive channel